MIEYIQFFPTLRCNKNCEFCFNRGAIWHSDFPLEKIRELIAHLKEQNIKSLDILGGEPFLYEHLFKLVEMAIEENLKVTISTNGTLTSKITEFLNIFSDKMFGLGVSINQKVDPILLEIIRENRLWMKTVITKGWIPDYNLLKLTKEIKTKYYLIYMDSLTENDLKNALSFPEFLKSVYALKEKFPNIEPVFCKGFIGGGNYRCPAGTEKITIMPDGSVYPCYLLAKLEKYKIGNILENSLSEILGNDKLKIFRNFSGNVCDNKLCIFYSQCKGGCPAHSIIHYGTHGYPDPRCKLL